MIFLVLFNNNESVKNVSMNGMARANLNVIKHDILDGKNNISGDTIRINFKDNAIIRIKVNGGAIGEFIPQRTNSKVDTIIYYNAEKIDYDLENEVSYLSEKAEVVYGDNQLSAGIIDANWKQNILEAKTSETIEPQLITPSNENPMIGSYMVFDLESNEGKIYDGYTKVGMGVFRGRGENEIFQGADKDVHIKNSLFTSCDLENPHYYFYSDYMKMIPNDKIIAKPMILYINEFRTIYLPFAIFPNSNNARKKWLDYAFIWKQVFFWNLYR